MGNRSSLLISGTMWTTASRSSLRDGFTARTSEPSSYRSSKSELWSTNPFLTWRHGFKFHIVDLFSGLWHPSSAKREGRIQVSFLFYNWVLRSRCQRVKYAGTSHWDSQEPAVKMFCSCSTMWETDTLFRSEASKLRRRFVNQQKIQAKSESVNWARPSVWSRWSLPRASVPPEHHECDVALLLQRLAGQAAASSGSGWTHQHVWSSVWDRGSTNPEVSQINMQHFEKDCIHKHFRIRGSVLQLKEWPL